MHSRLTADNLAASVINTIKLAACLLIVLSLAACASGPQTATNAPIESREVELESLPSAAQQENEDDQYTSSPIEQRNYQIEQAERYSRIAETEDNNLAVDSILSSAEFYIQGGDSQRAEQIVLGLRSAELDQVQSNRYEIIRAYAEYARSENVLALSRMRRLLDNPDNVAEAAQRQRVDALLLASFCYQNLNQSEAALSALIERESLLFGQARAETSRYIWQVIDRVSIQQRELIIDQTDDPLVRNRLEQSLSGEIGEQRSIPSQFNQWRNQEMGEQTLRTALPSQWSDRSPRSIVVLLPEGSRYQRAAQAVRDGINYQHELNNSPFRPSISFFDIGGNLNQVSQYYNAATQRGAELVIGPLGKDYADTLLQSLRGSFSVPTILLGGELPLPNGPVRLDLNPEHESERVAEHAIGRGYTNTVILAPTTTRGERVTTAFSNRWLQLGGKISKVVNYSPDQFDHSTELKLMFEQNQSQSRFRALSDTLGYRPQFSPYKRNDIDFIYLVADNNTGRIIRPQINFFGGHQLPVIATSDIYTGIEDAAKNMDLDNTSFPVMPWELASQQVSPYAGLLNKLFALGSDAYQLAAELSDLQTDPSASLQGNSGTLSVSHTGNVRIDPIWARFTEGKANTLSDTEIQPVNQQLLPGANRLLRQNKSGKGSYNESNWDPRESRRKSGT